MTPLIQQRAYQKATFRHKAGILGKIWRRQSGKSHALGSEGLDTMLGWPGITCVFMSAAIRLGMENLRKEAEIWRKFVADLRQAGQHITTSADDDRGEMIDVDKVADMLDHSKLELKIWHDHVTYSRSIVIAPNPDTAVGFTGWLFLDEVGRMPNFREVWEAAEPFAASNPEFRIRLATTPPPDDSHYSYEILAPKLDEVFPVSPVGNFYRSEAGFLMHRLDAWDAQAAGIPIYDSETRQPISPEEARAKAWDRDAWDRNFGTKFLRNTGTAAITSADMQLAQSRGQEEDVGIGVALMEQLPQNSAELEALVRSYLPADWVQRIGRHRVGLGLDLATSDKVGSNPSALVVTEGVGRMRCERLVLAFKSRDEGVTTQIVEMMVADLRRAGIHNIAGLAIDSSNEVFFAQRLRKSLSRLGIRVVLVAGGENVKHRGSEAPAKVVLGNLYCNLYSDAFISCPSGLWMAEDRRLVRRVNGSFAANVLPDGRHADTFDGGKLANWMLESGGPIEASAVSVGGAPMARPGLLNPYADRHLRRRGPNI